MSEDSNKDDAKSQGQEPDGANEAKPEAEPEAGAQPEKGSEPEAKAAAAPENTAAPGILYPLDSKPELPKASVLALQHVLTMFGATVAVPLLLGPNMNMKPEDIAILVSSVMLCSGLATLCQVTIGSRLPIIQGVSFSFLAPFFAIIGFVSAEVQNGAVDPAMQGAVTMQYIAGAVILGSLFEVVIGFSGLIGQLRRYLTPVVIGPVIMLIGLSLFQHGAPKAGSDVFIGGLTIFAVITFSLVLSRKFHLFRLFPILLAVILVWGLCTILSVAKVFEPEHRLASVSQVPAGVTTLGDRYVAVDRAEVTKQLNARNAQLAHLKATLKPLFKKRRELEGKAVPKDMAESIVKLNKEVKEVQGEASALSAMLTHKVSKFCIVPSGKQGKLQSASLASVGFEVVYGTEVAANKTLRSLQATHPSYVDLSRVSSAPTLRAPTTLIFPWGTPRWHFGFFVAVLFAYLASMIESFGDYHACSHMAGAGNPSAQQISNGIGSEGIGCLITGFFGGFASTSYSENIGLIGLTKVASRYVVIIASCILILLGLVAKFGAFAATIPGPVVGGLYCTLFGLISAVGIQQLSKADLQSDRTLFIAGFALFMGLSVPTFFTAKASGLQPGDVQAVYLPTAQAFLSALPDWLSDIMTTVGKSGMGVAAIIGLVLDNSIPGTDEERGVITE